MYRNVKMHLVYYLNFNYMYNTCIVHFEHDVHEHTCTINSVCMAVHDYTSIIGYTE